MKVSGGVLGRAIGLAGFALAVLYYLVWQLAHRGAFQYSTAIYPFDDADEWRYTACSRLVEHGYALFSQVFSAQPPLLFLSLAGSMRLFGDSIDGARWAEIGFGLVALLATTWTTWLLAGPVASGVSAVLLAISPGFLVYSRAIEAEIPMMALATLTLALALTYRRLGWRLLPVAAGLVLAAAILLKLFAIEAFLPGVWAVLGYQDRRRNLGPALWFVLAALVPVMLEMALVSPRAQWDQVIAMHQAASRVHLPDAPSTFRVLRDFFNLDLGLTIVAVAGLAVLAVLSDWDDLLFMVFWLGGTVLMLVVFRPLFPHHPVILLSGLAVSGGIAATLWVEQLRSHRWIAAVPIGLAALLFLAALPRVAHADRHALIAGESISRLQLADWVRAETAGSDLVAVDDLAVADFAHRLVPPGLCDPSNVRLHAGYLSASELIGQTSGYHARLVLPSFGLFVQVPRYMAWLRNHYRELPAPLGQHGYIHP